MHTSTELDPAESFVIQGTPPAALEQAPGVDLETDHDDEPRDAFRGLDARLIGLNRFVSGMFFAIVIWGALIGGSLVIWLLPSPGKYFAVPLAWLMIGGLAALFVVWWPRWEYEAWSYRIGRRVLELRYGVVWQVAVLIPLSRIQHVDLHRGPFERRCGLASLQVHTAGTRDASHRIPGLDVADATELRNQLIHAAHRGKHG